MLDHEIIKLPSLEHLGDVLKKHLADCPVHRVEQDCLLIQQQIGIVRNAIRHGVDALKHRKPPVIAADPV